MEDNVQLKITEIETTLSDLQYRYDRIVRSDKIIPNRNIYLLDGGVISCGTNNGVKLGEGATDKMGFYGVTPVDQPITVNDPSGGATVDSEARTAITQLIDRLQELGLIA